MAEGELKGINKEKSSKVLEGAEELLAEWGYALDMLAFSSREGNNSFREIEKDAAMHWFKKTIGTLPKTKTAYEAVLKYRDIADERGVIRKENFKLEEKGETILGTFLSQDCPYKECCISRKKERKDFICFRATPFVLAVELMADKRYKTEVIHEQTQPGKVCIISGVPTEISFKVGLSYKLSKGTVKIHDIDCGKIGIGLIDTVAVLPSRKDIANRKIIAMSYSQTKYPPGMVLLNVADARTLGLEEKDTVYIRKAAEGEEAKLVEVKEYEAAPGRYEGKYEVRGLESPEEEEAPEEEKQGAEEPGEEVPEEKPEIEDKEKTEKKPAEKEKPKQAPKKEKQGMANPEEKAPEKEEAPKETPKDEKKEKKEHKQKEKVAEKEEPEEKDPPKKEKQSKPEDDYKKQQRMKEFEAQIDAIRNA